MSTDVKTRICVQKEEKDFVLSGPDIGTAPGANAGLVNGPENATSHTAKRGKKIPPVAMLTIAGPVACNFASNIRRT